MKKSPSLEYDPQKAFWVYWSNFRRLFGKNKEPILARFLAIKVSSILGFIFLTPISRSFKYPTNVFPLFDLKYPAPDRMICFRSLPSILLKSGSFEAKQ